MHHYPQGTGRCAHVPHGTGRGAHVPQGTSRGVHVPQSTGRGAHNPRVLVVVRMSDRILLEVRTAHRVLLVVRTVVIHEYQLSTHCRGAYPTSIYFPLTISSQVKAKENVNLPSPQKLLLLTCVN